MPMEGVLQVLKDGKSQVQSGVLINLEQDYNGKISIMTRDSFQLFKWIDRDNMNDIFLGFFSLLTGCCAAASEVEPAILGVIIAL